MNASLPSALGLSLLLFGVSVSAVADTTNSPSETSPKWQTCFQCGGSGKMKCPTCQGTGNADCPGPCLKLSRAGWKHMQVAGHPDTDVWMTFHNTDSTWTAYNQNHVGDVIKLQDGHWVDSGKCPVCGGSGKVKCRACDGSGQVKCTMCEGEGKIPGSWSAFDNPRMKHRPDRFVLKDGRTIVGRKVAMTGDRVTIRTATGDEEIAISEIKTEEHQDTGKSQ